MATRTITRKLSEGVVWTSSTSFIIKIIGILYTIVVLSHVSVYEYGLIELAMSLIPLLGIMSLAGLQPVIIADLVSLKTKEKYAEMRDLFSAFIALRVSLGLLAFVILNVAVFFFLDTFPKEALQMVQILSLVFIAGPIRTGLFTLLTVSHRFSTLAQIRLFEELFKLALVSVLLAVFSFGPLGVIIAFVVTDFLITFCFLPATRSVIREDFGNKLWSNGFFDPLSVLRNHGKWSVIQSSLHQFGQNLRPWIIQFFLGTQAVGIYATATGLYQHMHSLVPIAKVVSPIVPELKDQPRRLTQLLHVAIKYQIILLTIALGGIAVVLPFIINTYFPSYIEAFPLFMVLAIALLPDTFSRIYEAAFHAFQLQKSLFFANMVKLAMIILLLPPLLMTVGLYGLVIEFFLTQLVYAATRYRKLRERVAEFYFSWREFLWFSDSDRLLLRKLKNHPMVARFFTQTKAESS